MNTPPNARIGLDSTVAMLRAVHDDIINSLTDNQPDDAGVTISASWDDEHGGHVFISYSTIEDDDEDDDLELAPTGAEFVIPD